MKRLLPVLKDQETDHPKPPLEPSTPSGLTSNQDELDPPLENRLNSPKDLDDGHFVRSLVGLDRSAAQAAFSEFLNDRSLSPPQIRFVEMVIEQLTARGVMDWSALYEPPFNKIHGGGPDELFSGKENVIEGIFKTLKEVNTEMISKAR